MIEFFNKVWKICYVEIIIENKKMGILWSFGFIFFFIVCNEVRKDSVFVLYLFLIIFFDIVVCMYKWY